MLPFLTLWFCSMWPYQSLILSFYVWKRFFIYKRFKDKKKNLDYVFFLLSHSAGKRRSYKKIFLCLTEMSVNRRSDLGMAQKLSAHKNWTPFWLKLGSWDNLHESYFTAQTDFFSHMNIFLLFSTFQNSLGSTYRGISF